MEKAMRLEKYHRLYVVFNASATTIIVVSNFR